MTGGPAAISTRLADASAIAQAALVCARAVSEREALRIALDLDEILFEATTLHAVLCLLGRMSRHAGQELRPDDRHPTDHLSIPPRPWLVHEPQAGSRSWQGWSCCKPR